MDDSKKAVSLDAKVSGDYVYVLGEDREELGGSEYFAMVGEQTTGKKFIGNNVPTVRPDVNRKLYESYSQALNIGLVASAQSVHRGGLGIALAKTSMGGRLGMDISLTQESRSDVVLYSESQGRIVVTVNPAYAPEFERAMDGNKITRIGTVRADNKFIIRGATGTSVVETSVDDMLHSYKETFRDY
jgi:phosphoribosylformylglycinamidine synthase